MQICSTTEINIPITIHLILLLMNPTLPLIGDLARNGKIAQHYGIHIDYLFLEKRNMPEIKWLNTAQMFQTNAGHEELEANSTLKFLSRSKKFSFLEI